MSSPLVVFLELVGVYVPLAFHAGYGIHLVLRERAGLRRPSAARGYAWAVDRVSSLVALLFIAYHVTELRIPILFGRMREPDIFSVLCDTLSATVAFGVPLSASFYLVGLAATSYHFAHGLLGCCMTFDVRLPPRGQRWAVGAAVVLGVGTFLLGATTVLYFATGSTIPGMSTHAERPRAPTL